MNILFTCAGRRTYLLKYFRENLSKGDKIVATDMQLSAPALQAADIRIQVPSIYDPTYVDIMLDICKKYEVSILIPLNDLELPILAEHKTCFERAGVRVIVSRPEVIAVCFDKYETARWVKSIGLQTPRTYICVEDVKDALSKGEIEFPMFMKPRWGSGSIGLESVSDLEELEMTYYFLKKKLKKTILATASVSEESIIIQEKLTGAEFGLDVMNDLNENNIAVSVKQKLAMRAGETDKAVTVDIPAVREIGQKIGEQLRHIGNLDVDIMQRSNGDYCVLELNPRFGGGYPFSYEAGVNMPKAIIEWVRENQVEPSILHPIYNKTFSKNDYLMEIF